MRLLDLNKNETVKEVPLTPHSYYQYDFNHQYVVWSAEDIPTSTDPQDPMSDPNNIKGDIYLYDLAQGEVKRITNDDYDQIAPKIWSHYLVWMDDRATKKEEWPQQRWKIYLYDIDTGKEKLISTAPGQHSDPVIDNGVVVWEDGRHVDDPILRGGGNVPKNNTDIYGYDIATEKEFPIATGAYKDGAPDLSYPWVVWEDYNNDPDLYGADITAYNLDTHVVVPVTHDKIRQMTPQVGGSVVAWTDERRGGSESDVFTNGKKPNSDVFVYDLNHNREQRISGEKVDLVGGVSEHWVAYGEDMQLHWTIHVKRVPGNL
ncbi:MAG TPA: hypothetical protein VFV52_12375 [Bacilli bacterium]|nr:hypothetical protein [Bacilli bacterium]